jgi:hypothetical protein
VGVEDAGSTRDPLGNLGAFEQVPSRVARQERLNLTVELTKSSTEGALYDAQKLAIPSERVSVVD